MRILHFLPIFHKNLDVFFSNFPNIHGGNTLVIDNMPHKSMFNNLYTAFLSCLITFMGRINICWGLLSLTWKIFIHPNTIFPPLLNTIPLVGLNVLI